MFCEQTSIYIRPKNRCMSDSIVSIAIKTISDWIFLLTEDRERYKIQTYFSKILYRLYFVFFKFHVDLEFWISVDEYT